MAAMDRFDIKIKGQGGHGAMPHLCVDALDAGTQVVNALQRIVSRHMDPLEPTVVTVGTFHAGTAFNIIPGEVELSGTTRTFNPDIWDTWEARIEKVVRGVCESMGTDFELKYSQGYPATINDDAMAQVVRRCAEKVVGTDRVVIPARTMGGEDFAFYLQRSKGCFFALGVGREGAAPVHSPKFDFNEDILPLVSVGRALHRSTVQNSISMRISCRWVWKPIAKSPWNYLRLDSGFVPKVSNRGWIRY
jgi:amidohydrolase